MNNHVKVTVEFSKRGGRTYDIAISKKMTVKQLLIALKTSLHEQIDVNSVIKIPLKGKTLQSEDRLLDCYISNGELLIIEGELD